MFECLLMDGKQYTWDNVYKDWVNKPTLDGDILNMCTHHYGHCLSLIYKNIIVWADLLRRPECDYALVLEDDINVAASQPIAVVTEVLEQLFQHEAAGAIYVNTGRCKIPYFGADPCGDWLKDPSKPQGHFLFGATETPPSKHLCRLASSLGTYCTTSYMINQNWVRMALKYLSKKTLMWPENNRVYPFDYLLPRIAAPFGSKNYTQYQAAYYVASPLAPQH